MKIRFFIFQIFVGLIETLKEIKLHLLVCYTTNFHAAMFIRINSSKSIYEQKDDEFIEARSEWILCLLICMLQIWRTIFVRINRYVLCKIFKFSSYYYWSFICGICCLSCSRGPWLVMGYYSFGIWHTYYVRIF